MENEIGASDGKQKKKKRKHLSDLQLVSSMERPGFLLSTFVLHVVLKFKSKSYK